MGKASDFSVEVGYDKKKNIVIAFRGLMDSKQFQTMVVLGKPQAIAFIESVKEAILLSDPVEA